MSSPVTRGTVTANLSTSRVTGVAPLSVFFDGTATTSTQTAKPFHDLEYSWDFNDSLSGNWSVGSRTIASRNTARGPVASHVFETPGTYNVKMTATDGTTTNNPAITVQITVSDPETVFSANTICFSTTGTFTGCPTGAATQTISDFATAINNYQTSKKRLLFRRGETWTASTSARITTTGPGIVGAFGTSTNPSTHPNPTWIAPSDMAALYLSDPSTPGIRDWRISDIEIDGQGRSTSAIGGNGGFDQLLLLRLYIHNVSNGIGMASSMLDYFNNTNNDGSIGDTNPLDHGHTIWDQFAVVDTRLNVINNGVGVSGMIAAYITAARFTFMGNNFNSGGGGEHVLRTPYIGRGVVSNNYLAQPASDKHCWQLHAPGWGYIGVTGGQRYSEKIVASDNTFFGGNAAEIIYVAPQQTGNDERLRNIIIERNYFIAGTVATTGIESRGSVSLTTFRNNIVNMSGSLGAGATGFNVGDGGIGPVPTDISFLNNTIYSNRPVQFFAFTIGTVPTNITVKNNLAYAANSSNAAMVVGTGASGLVTGGNTPAGSIAISPAFASVPSGNSLTGTDFQIAGTSYAAANGAAVPVSLYSDFFMTSNNGQFDIGAVHH